MEKVFAVIDPACNRAEVECFNAISDMCSLNVHYHLPALVGMGSLEEDGYLERLAGVVIIGSSASVYDNLPWQEPFHAYLKKLVDHNVPTLGICYGHQALAHVFGGTVGYHSESKEKFQEMREVAVDACLLWDQAHKGELFYTHREVVTKLPSTFMELARSKRFPNEAIAHRTKPVFGFQAHLESIPCFTTSYGLVPPADLGRLSFGRKLLESFVEFCTKP